MAQLSQDLAALERDALQRVVASMREIRTLSKSIENADSMDGYMSSNKQIRIVRLRLPEELAAFGKASCRQICHATLVSLPAELRYEIYERICLNERYDVAQTCPQLSYGPAFKPLHYLNPDYVGQAFFNEFLGRFYRTALFDFADSHPSIRTWLGYPDQYGLRPDALVSNVNLDFCNDSSTPGLDADQRRAYLDNLRDLSDMKPGGNILLTFKIQYLVSDKFWLDWTRRFCNVLFDLLPAIAQLHDKGYNIKIFANPYSYICRRVTCTCSKTPQYEDRAYVFTMKNCGLASHGIINALSTYQQNDDVFRREYLNQLLLQCAR